MGFQTIVHGRIVCGGDMAQNKAVIDSLQANQAFPWVMKEMFAVPPLERPYFYDSPIITFGATYKQLESDLTSFLIKFEHILHQLDFDTAKLEIESEVLPDLHCFWKSKKHDIYKSEKYEEYGLHLADRWYYGYGSRNMWGIRQHEDNEEEETALLKIYETVHPFQTTEEHRVLLRQLLDFIEPGKETYFYDLPDAFTKHHDLYALLTKFALENDFFTFYAYDSYNLPEDAKAGPYILLEKTD